MVLRHLPLDLERASNGILNAVELDKRAVAGSLEDLAAMFGD